MYHFMLDGLSCHCDTAAELQTISSSVVKRDALKQAVKDPNRSVRIVAEIGSSLGKPPEWWTAESDGTTTVVKKTEKPANKAAETKKKLLELAKSGADKPKATTSRVVKKSVEELAALPYVKGGVTWEVTHKIGKKLKRTDYNQLRSELFARKQLPK